MYAVIVIEARISYEERMNWISSYLIGLAISQVVLPLIKACLDCFLIVLLCRPDIGVCL